MQRRAYQGNKLLLILRIGRNSLNSSDENRERRQNNREAMVPSKLLSVLLLLALLTCAQALSAAPRDLSLPANTQTILDHIYSGRRDVALEEIRRLQQQSPENPLGYLLEAENEWWQIWLSSADFKYGMTLTRHHDKSRADAHYFELTSKAYSLAESNLRQHDSGEMRLYAGMADALASRLYGIRGEYRATAHVGVRARDNFLKALQLDPSLADAYTGLGLYNYYVDTLSTLARMMRFFMGIPGGSKQEGIQQLERAIHEGQLTPALARFYLALNLHTYDQKYEQALEVLNPLVEKYPQNPIFQLARGDLYAKLGRREQAEASYRAASADAEKVPETECRAKTTYLVQQSLAALNAH
jgi:tetratricopeptide (TPR) repeat protein